MTDQRAAERFDAAVGPSCWAIDDAAVDAGTLSLRGWALSPGRDAGSVAFSVNGRRFEQVRSGLARDDLARLFWHRPDAASGGFECQTSLSAEDLAADALELHFCDRATGKPFEPRHAYHFPMTRNPEAPLPLPEGPRMYRTTGSESVANFRLTGLSTAAKIRDITAELKRDIGSLGHVLDWGCGCGRVARFCSDWPGFAGTDVDADNAGWCRDNLRFGDFRPIALFPPTPFAEGKLDLIFGISVMTHLALDVQQAWLAELYRISAPYGLVLLTTLGEHAAVRAGFTPEAFAQFTAAGHVFHHDGGVMDAALGSTGYYGTMFMTHDEIRRQWSRWFSVDRIVPAYIGNHQDLVVLRRR